MAKCWVGTVGPLYGFVKCDTAPVGSEDMVRLSDLSGSTGLVNIVVVASISNPSAELASIAGPATGSKLVVTVEEGAGANKFAIYLWDLSVSVADPPYVVAGDGGYWVAIGGRFCAIPQSTNARSKHEISEYKVTPTEDNDDYYAVEYWVEGGSVLWDVVLGSGWGGDLRRWAYSISGSWTNYLVMGNTGIFSLPYNSRIRYYLTYGQSIMSSATPQTVSFSGMSWDSQNEFSGGRFYPKVRGYYHVDAKLSMDFSGLGTTSNYAIYITKNGVEQAGFGKVIFSGVSYESINISDTVYAVYGDFIDIRVLQVTGANRNLVAGSVYSYVSINKVS